MNFGKGRIQVARLHPGTIKITHVFPLLFSLGLLVVPFLYLIGNFWANWLAGAYAIYFLLICLTSMVISRSIIVGVFSIPAGLIQLTGYGYGFLKEAIKGSAGKSIV